MNPVFTEFALERPGIIVPAALLLLAAAGGVIWSNLAAHDRQAPAAPVGAPVPVVTTLVSTDDIARGQVLTARDFTLRPGGISPAGGLHRTEDAEGHMALAPVRAGAPILAAQISPRVAAGISAQVPEGYRAYAIPVSEADIAGGFLQAGDHVDLYVTLPGALFGERAVSGGKPDDQSKSALLLQAVAVLAVGTKLQTDGSANTMVRTVTLALQAADLAKVALAARLGTITLAIRNPVDAAALAPSQAGLGALMNNLANNPANKESATEPSPATRPRPRVMHGIPMLSGARSITISAP